MRKLILNPGNGAREFPVGKGITIGRDSANTIQIEGQKVEEKHAKVALKGNLLFVEDLDTPFGIVVNGKKVTRWALNKGDVIEIGGATLAYEEDDAPEPAPAKPKAPAARKPDEKPSTAQAKPAAKPSAPQVKPAAKAAPSKPALKPATAGAASSKAIPAARPEPKSDMKIVLPTAEPAKKTSSRSALPAVGPTSAERRSDPQASVRIKLNAAKDVLDDGSKPAEAPTTRSSMAKISLKSMTPASSATSGRLADPTRSSSASERMKLEGAKDIERDAFATRRSGKQRHEPLVKPMSGRTKAILAGVGLAIVVALSAAMLIPALGAWIAQSSAAAEHDRMIEETIARLKAAPAKSLEDIQVVLPKLKLANTWEKVEALLGTPNYQVKGNIALFNNDTGVYEMNGYEFKAYYMKDPFFPNPKEGDVAPIILFLVNSSDKVSFLENHRLLARNPNLKIARPEPATTTTTTTTEETKTEKTGAAPAEEPKKQE
ncbi:MAG: FHA domain-containing protein [Planctomycetota bacterium]|nr:FHA domain-containing protein [Planctomycetota bacterium]